MTMSVLVVTNAEDDRPSTAALRGLVEVLERRSDVAVTVFFLRRSRRRRTTWPGARVVDDLRIWWPAAAVERVVSLRVADALRGRRLRWWLRSVGPDVVLLDDGLGFRVVEHVSPRPVCVSRLNGSLPDAADLEPGPLPDPDVVVVAIDTEPAPGAVAAGVPVIREQELLDPVLATRRAAEAFRVSTRDRLGIPTDVPLVAGWGFDGWLDGPDVFIRSLWALRTRHGIAAHGVWFGDTDAHDHDQLLTEARRAGVGDAYHLLPYSGRGEIPDDAFAADAAMLPTRLALVREHLSPAIASGLVVTTFRVAGLDDPAIVLVDDLDVEALAAATAESLAGDRAARSRAALVELDADRWVGSIVDAAANARRRR